MNALGSFVFLLTVFFSMPIFAGDAEISAIEDKLNEEFKWLKAEAEADVVWSASKYEQKTSEAPSLVSIIRSEDIKKFGYRTLADILQRVSGTYITYNRNYNFIGVRGFGQPGDLNTRVLLMTDGHRINDDVFQQALIGTDFPLDVDLIDRVEVTRGPGSCLYGTNAFFSVINVITKKGHQIDGSQVSAEVGTSDTYKSRVTFGKSFSHGLEILLSASVYDSRGDDRLYYSEFDDPSSNKGIAENRDDDKYCHLFLKTSWKDFTLSAVYGSRDKDVPTASFWTVFDEPFNTVDNRGYAELKYDHRFDEMLNISSRIYYDRYVYKGYYPYSAETEDGESYIYMNRDDDTSEWVGGDIMLTRKMFGNSSFTFGAEFQYNTRQDMLNYDENPYQLLSDDTRRSSNWAVYFHDETRILGSLTLNAGIRYDRYESFGGIFNPRLSLIHKPFENTTLKLIYGTAFRAPNFYELSVNESWQKKDYDIPNPDPEKISTYEIIAEQSFGEFIKGFVSGFYYKIDGLISQVPYEDDWILENADHIEAKGIELELQGKWKNGFAASLNYTLQQVEDTHTHETLPNSPEHLVKGNLTIPLIPEKLFGSFEGQYMSRRNIATEEETSITAKEHFVANLTVSGMNFIKGLECSASIYNLFDEHYGDPADENHIQKMIEREGRSFRFKITYSF